MISTISLDSWIASAKKYYEASSDVPVDPRAEEQVIRIVGALPESCRDFEVQANEDGGAVLIIDNLPKTRRIIIEVRSDGAEGKIKLIDKSEVQWMMANFPENGELLAGCVDWLATD